LNPAALLQPGSALDLASGAGRNALWLAGHGWQVTAVDGASEAVESLRASAAERNLSIAVHVADLEKDEYKIEPSSWDLIAILYYLQLDLFGLAKEGVKPGGILIAVVHIIAPGQEQSRHSLRPGELREFFKGWEILHLYEGIPNDKPHRRPVAEIVARRPT
jgi:tellurite methyltransferase